MTQQKTSTETKREWPGRKRRDPRLGIVTSVVSLAFLIVVAVLMINRSAPPQVTQLRTASALDNAFEPVEVTDVFHPTDTIFVSAKIINYQSSHEIKARWRFEGADIDSTELETHGQIGNITAGFSLSRPDPWPVGKYTVDIMYADTAISSTSFSVAP